MFDNQVVYPKVANSKVERPCNDAAFRDCGLSKKIKGPSIDKKERLFPFFQFSRLINESDQPYLHIYLQLCRDSFCFMASKWSFSKWLNEIRIVNLLPLDLFLVSVEKE